MQFSYEFRSAAISIEDGKRALICFDYHNEQYCELFDGSSVPERQASSRFPHDQGKLGLYKGNPTTVGGRNRGAREVETLVRWNWHSLNDFPRYTYLFQPALGATPDF